MGPLNEFQRRFVDLAQQRRWILEANVGGPEPEPYGYPLVLGSATNTLTNGVSFQGVIAIQADAYFLWQTLSVGVTIPTTALLGGPEQMTDGGNLLLQITNPGTAEDLVNVPAGFAGIPAAIAAGSPIAAAAGIPYMFPIPVLISPNTNINITVQKLGTNAGADNPDMTGAYVMLNGVRIPVWSA